MRTSLLLGITGLAIASAFGWRVLGPASESTRSHEPEVPGGASSAHVLEAASTGRPGYGTGELRFDGGRSGDSASAATHPAQPEGIAISRRIESLPGPARRRLHVRFEDERLATAGLDADEIDRLRARWDQSIDDFRARRGIESPILDPVQQRSLVGDLQRNNSAADVDALLYGSGLPNRLVVTSVNPTGVASHAGLQAGDSVLSYNGQPIYDGATLQQSSVRQVLTREGATLEIVRDGKQLTLQVDGGHFGASTELKGSEAPLPSR